MHAAPTQRTARRQGLSGMSACSRPRGLFAVLFALFAVFAHQASAQGGFDPVTSDIVGTAGVESDLFTMGPATSDFAVPTSDFIAPSSDFVASQSAAPEVTNIAVTSDFVVEPVTSDFAVPSSDFVNPVTSDFVVPASTAAAVVETSAQQAPIAETTQAAAAVETTSIFATTADAVVTTQAVADTTQAAAAIETSQAGAEVATTQAAAVVETTQAAAAIETTQAFVTPSPTGSGSATYDALLALSTTTVTAANAAAYAAELQTLVSSPGDLTAADIPLAWQCVTNMLDFSGFTTNAALQQSLTNTIGELLDPAAFTASTTANANNAGGTQFGEIVERLSLLLFAAPTAPCTQTNSQQATNGQLDLRGESATPTTSQQSFTIDGTSIEYTQDIASGTGCQTFGFFSSPSTNIWTNPSFPATLASSVVSINTDSTAGKTSVITFAVTGSLVTGSKKAECSFWDYSTQRWSTAGCTLTSQTSTTVTCTCTHLSTFAVVSANDAGSSPQASGLSGGAIAGIIIGVVALLFIILIAVIAYKRKGDSMGSYQPNKSQDQNLEMSLMSRMDLKPKPLAAWDEESLDSMSEGYKDPAEKRKSKRPRSFIEDFAAEEAAHTNAVLADSPKTGRNANQPLMSVMNPSSDVWTTAPGTEAVMLKNITYTGSAHGSGAGPSMPIQNPAAYESII